ncbi:hypothetical protein LZM41_20950, partial [Pseudomonas aeruginosa]|nr:hypothetical protein [Pseudomonas aeruginosa]
MGTHVIKMPDIGEGIAEVELVEWHVQVGDSVNEDQVLAEVMTDKATVEIPSPVAGRILALGGQPGQVMAVGGELIRLEVEGAGNLAEFNLHTVWVSIPHFFDYLAETIPTLHWHLLFADGRTEGSLAYWGYRLNIQLPLIWETLQLALAATIFSVLVATVLAFLAAGNTYTPASVRLAIRTLVAFLRTMPELAWAVMFVMAFGIGAIPGFLA